MKLTTTILGYFVLYFSVVSFGQAVDSELHNENQQSSTPYCKPLHSVPSTPCREILVNVVEHVLNFVRDFPRLCWDRDCSKPTPNPSTKPTPRPTPSPTPEPLNTTQTPLDTLNSTASTPSVTIPTSTETLTTPPVVESNPVTPKPTPTAVPCVVVNDLAILLDSSGSIGSENYETAKKFVGNLSFAFTQKLENRLLFIDYSFEAHIIVALEPRLPAAEIEKKILKTHYQGWTTYTGKAIKLATKELNRNRRPGVPQRLIVFTDGVSTDDAVNPANVAMSAGITNYAVGIGSGVNRTELLAIAGGNQQRVYYVASYNDLHSILQDVSLEICPEGPPPT